jgi:RND family efflux transporter MFP subunit
MPAKHRLPMCSLLLACTLVGCKEPTAEPPVRPVRAVKVGDVTGISGRSFPGRASATEEVNLSFRVSGPLVELSVKVGDEVTKDQVMARIDPRDFDVALENSRGVLGRAQAELEAMQAGARPEELEQLKADVQRTLAEYERARNELERASILLKDEIITQAEFDRNRQVAVKAQAELRSAEEALRIGEIGAREEDKRAKQAEIRSLKSAVDAAEDQLNYTRLKAPFDGVVAVTYVENFETIQAKQQILRLLDTSQIEITIDIPESLISSAKYVKDLTCVFDAFPETKIKGVQIKEIGTEASDITRTFPVTLIMDQPDPATGIKILPGMAGRASGRAELPDQVEEVGFEVPESAIFAGEGGRQYVWAIDESSMTVHQQPVTPGTLTSLGMRVKGVNAGQLIVTAGVDYLDEGQKIRLLGEPEVRSQ